MLGSLQALYQAHQSVQHCAWQDLGFMTYRIILWGLSATGVIYLFT